jgi:nitrite reductase/ring-hydroxylating ferredoxin subunit
MARHNENESTLAQESLSRRDVLLRMGRWLLGSASVAALVGAGRFLRPGILAGAPSIYPIGRLSDFRVGTLTWLRERELFVMRDETGLGVFSTRCTHLGCIVRRTAEGFLCPCHGARYDAFGKVLAGPARRPLPWYYVWLESDGQAWVDVSREVSPAPAPLVVTDTSACRVLSPRIPRRCSSSKKHDDSAPAGGPLLGATRPASACAREILPTKDRQS